MRKNVIISTLLIAGLSLTASQANAGTVTDLFGQYNGIILNNFTPGGSEVEGSLYVGGNFNAGNTTTINPQAIPDGFLGGTLVVGGNLNGQINMQSGSTLVGGDITATFNNNGNGSVTTGGTSVNINNTTVNENAVVSIDTTGIAADFNTLSQDLVALNDGDFGFNVLDVDSSYFTGQAPMYAAGTTTIINVSGMSLDTAGWNLNGIYQNVLFNFYEAESVDINAAFGASILAPLATVENITSIEGTVIALNYINSGELHPEHFTGDLSGVSAVPLPAAGWLFLSALIGLGAARRRKV